MKNYKKNKFRTELSESEIKVCKHLYYSYGDIARKLFIAKSTVITHVQSAFFLTNTHSRHQLIIKLLKTGTLKIEDFIYDENY